MNYTIIIAVVLLVAGGLWLSSFRKTKLLSNFPFEEGEEIVFEEKPASLVHKKSSLLKVDFNRRFTVLMRPVIKITNKKRIIFAQSYRKDALVYGVFSINDLTEKEQTAWSSLGYLFAHLSPEDATATSSKKAQYEITLTGRMPKQLSSKMPIDDFIMQIHTDDLSQYETHLGIKIPVTAQ